MSMGYDRIGKKIYTRKINTIKRDEFIFNLHLYKYTWMEYCEKIDMHDMQTIMNKENGCKRWSFVEIRVLSFWNCV